MDRKDVPDADLPSTQLLAWLKGEMRERDRDHGTHHRAKLHRHSSQQADSSSHSAAAAAAAEHEQEVLCLFSETKSKKSNRRNIIEQAQGRAASLVNEFLDGPIAAVETTDKIMELIRGTKLSDPESWRQVMHLVPTAERRYLGELHDLLGSLALDKKDVSRNAFVYNFRTGKCIYYDLGA